MGLIVVGFEIIPPEAKGGAITIGNFDGVHRGHRELVSRLRRMADQVSGPAIVLTFDPPPSHLLRPESAPPSLTWMERRAEILFDLGVDVLCVCTTTYNLLELSAESFFRQILIEKLGISAIVEGPNFRFGKDRLGDIELLGEFCQQYEVELSIASGQSDDGEWISSSRIRTMIAKGEMAAANRLLVEPYRLKGLVVHGEARGRQIGFPTANLEQVPVMIPAPGVYAGRGFVNGQAFPAAINIGPNPTFGEAINKVEVHLIHFASDLYGQHLELELFEKLRSIHAFASKDELIEQLKVDSKRAQQIAESV